jgi:hypothetical protein
MKKYLTFSIILAGGSLLVYAIYKIWHTEELRNLIIHRIQKLFLPVHTPEED